MTGTSVVLADKQITSKPQSRQSRVLSFFSNRRNWDSPNPSPTAECVPSPLVPRGGDTLAGERRSGRVPIPTSGHTFWYSVYVRTLCCKLTGISGKSVIGAMFTCSASYSISSFSFIFLQLKKNIYISNPEQLK